MQYCVLWYFQKIKNINDDKENHQTNLFEKQEEINNLKQISRNDAKKLNDLRNNLKKQLKLTKELKERLDNCVNLMEEKDKSYKKIINERIALTNKYVKKLKMKDQILNKMNTVSKYEKHNKHRNTSMYDID